MAIKKEIKETEYVKVDEVKKETKLIESNDKNKKSFIHSRFNFRYNNNKGKQ